MKIWYRLAVATTEVVGGGKNKTGRNDVVVDLTGDTGAVKTTASGKTATSCMRCIIELRGDS